MYLSVLLSSHMVRCRQFSRGGDTIYLNSFRLIYSESNIFRNNALHSPFVIINCNEKKMFRQFSSSTMDDPEIQETVESILGKEVKIVDCEKKSSIKEEEILLINGLPVTLEGRDGRAIKQALLTGQVPPCDLLNTLLIRTGILKAPVKLETSLSVKTSTVTKEEVTVSKEGKIIDERSRETKENNFYTSTSSEVWEPIKIIPNPELVNNKYSTSKFSDISSHQNGYETGSERKFGSCSSASSYESDGPLFNGTRTCLSKDSGHLTNSSSGKVFTQSSADSLSSLDETDYKNDLVNKFRKSSLHSNGYKDYTTVSTLPLINFHQI